MTEVYVIRNQHGHYWGKSKEWVSGSDAKTVVRARHEDEAVNTLFELSAKDVDLRGQVVPAELSERGEPQIEPSEVPLPGPQLDLAAGAEPAGEAAVEATDSQAQEAP